MLVSSHILSEISQTCDRILVLREGRLVADGSEAELSRRVNTGTRLLLTLTGDTGAIPAWLNSQPTVSAVTVNSEQDGRIDLDIELTGDHRESLVGAIVTAGYGLRRLEDAMDELEEIFIDLTKEGEA